MVCTTPYLFHVGAFAKPTLVQTIAAVDLFVVTSTPDSNQFCHPTIGQNYCDWLVRDYNRPSSLCLFFG